MADTNYQHLDCEVTVAEFATEQLVELGGKLLTTKTTVAEVAAAAVEKSVLVAGET